MLQKILLLYCLMVSFAFAQDALRGSPSPVNDGLASQNTTNSTTAAPTTHTPPTTSHSTSPPTNSTTTKPTTPTSQPSSSSPAPEPSSTVPPPQKGHFMLPNETCIIADFAIQVTVNMDNNSFSFDLPTNVTVNGSCSNTTDELNLSWVEDMEKMYSLSFWFKKNESTSKYMVSQISLVMHMQNVSTTTFKITEDKFETSVLKSYKCDKEQEIKLEEEPNTSNNSFAMLRISQVRLQAFHTSEDDKFSVAEDCADSSSTDIVPIAVGCALVVLIVIVLIAYLLGRRRSQNRGYLSM